jgi:hypothetical protein
LTKNFAFILNIGSLEESSYEVFPGYVLRRAVDDEIDLIREHIDKLTGPLDTPMAKLHWDHKSSSSGSNQFTWTLADRSDWRYYVIAFDGETSLPFDFQIASDLSSLELEVGFTLQRLHAINWTPSRLFHVLGAVQFTGGFLRAVTTAHIDEIVSLCAHLRNVDANLFNGRAFGMQLGALKSFDHHSPLRTLGYFALLESLLTHAPLPTDPYDSITRQIKKKLILLNNRWTPPLNYSPFGNADPEKIWSKMYSYRSQLAHGGNPHFGGEFQVLRGHQQVMELVKETVKAIIRRGLIEPRLLLDLREC